MDGIIDSMDMSLTKLREMVKVREAWPAAVPGGHRVGHNLVTEQQIQSESLTSAAHEPICSGVSFSAQRHRYAGALLLGECSQAAFSEAAASFQTWLRAQEAGQEMAGSHVLHFHMLCSGFHCCFSWWYLLSSTVTARWGWNHSSDPCLLKSVPKRQPPCLFRRGHVPLRDS